MQNNLGQLLEHNVKTYQQLSAPRKPRKGANSITGPPPGPMNALLSTLATRFVRALGARPACLCRSWSREAGPRLSTVIVVVPGYASACK